MKSKLGAIFIEISKFEERQKESLSPEYIALQFMKFINIRTGKKISYFRNKNRNGSKAWKHFEKLSELLISWQNNGMTINLDYYFEKHLKIIGKGKNLHPSQLVLPRSYKYVLGRDAIDPTYYTLEEPPDYEECVRNLELYLKYFNGNIEETLDAVGFAPEFKEEYRRRNNIPEPEE